MRVLAQLTTLSIALLAASAAAAQPVRLDVTPDGVPADGPALYPVASTAVTWRSSRPLRRRPAPASFL